VYIIDEINATCINNSVIYAEITVSNRRTVGLNEIVGGYPKGDMKYSLGHGGLGGSSEAPSSGDGTATRSLTHYPARCR